VPEQPADLVERVVLVPASTERVLLHSPSDLVNDLGAEPDNVEGVKDGDRVGQPVMDGVVESDRGAVSSVSAGPFPRPAPRTGRATSTASGSPRGVPGVSRRRWL
jgi:hypothetical protein